MPKTPQVEMLLKCYKIMHQRYSTQKSAMSALVQWIAYKSSVESFTDVSTPTLTLEMLNKLEDIFDIGLLQSDPWDHLGDLAYYLGLNDWLGVYLTREETIKWAKKNLPIKQLNTGNIIFFDPSAGTGRLCLALHNLRVRCVMAVTEAMSKPFRLLVINQKLYNLPLFALRDNVSYPFDSTEWLKSNMYIPCHLRKVKK